MAQYCQNQGEFEYKLNQVIAFSNAFMARLLLNNYPFFPLNAHMHVLTTMCMYAPHKHICNERRILPSHSQLSFVVRLSSLQLMLCGLILQGLTLPFHSPFLFFQRGLKSEGKKTPHCTLFRSIQDEILSDIIDYLECAISCIPTCRVTSHIH